MTLEDDIDVGKLYCTYCVHTNNATDLTTKVTGRYNPMLNTTSNVLNLFHTAYADYIRNNIKGASNVKINMKLKADTTSECVSNVLGASNVKGK